MIVPILKPDGELLEWSMVEIQGRVESLTGEEISEIGTLHVSPQVSRFSSPPYRELNQNTV